VPGGVEFGPSLAIPPDHRCGSYDDSFPELCSQIKNLVSHLFYLLGEEIVDLMYRCFEKNEFLLRFRTKYPRLDRFRAGGFLVLTSALRNYPFSHLI